MAKKNKEFGTPSKSSGVSVQASYLERRVPGGSSVWGPAGAVFFNIGDRVVRLRSGEAVDDVPLETVERINGRGLLRLVKVGSQELGGQVSERVGPTRTAPKSDKAEE